MALSRTEVINRALQMIAADTISDPDEDTISARASKLEYAPTVRAELSAHPWYFAKAQASLPASADAPAFKFAYAYTLPTDFLRLVELRDRWMFTIDRQAQDTNPIPFYELQGRAILTDLTAPLAIGYIRDVTDDPTIWHPLFEEVVVASLAMALANPLAKSTGLVELAAKVKRMKLAEARRVNAIQNPSRHIPDSSWMLARVY
jgi:hypothetical protein